MKELILPDNILTIGEWAFANCEKLESVSLPKGLTKISEWMFSGCDALKSIIIPENVVPVGEAAFYDSNEFNDVYFKGAAPSEWGESVFGYKIIISYTTSPENQAGLRLLGQHLTERYTTLLHGKDNVHLNSGEHTTNDIFSNISP